MKITTKINLLTTAWLLCVLVIINVVVFFSFLTITVNMEEDALSQKASDIVKEINLDHPYTEIDEQLKDYLTIHSYIRIIYPDGKLLTEVTNDKQLTKNIKAHYTRIQETRREVIFAGGGEEQVLYLRVPITSGKNVKGTLEIGERLLGLEMRKDILLSILGLCTILAGFLSLIGGRWLSNIIMRPISNMIKTMEEIEQSGVPKKIVIHNKTKDELEQMATTFNRMIERLGENIEKQEQFISDASHELKTPLTVIKSYSSLLKRRGLQNNEISAEAIEAIYSEATRIQKMTEMFLNMATAEKENILEVKSVNLNSLFREIQQQLKEAYKREINLHFSQDPIIVQADELKIKQVMIILIDNAIKYSHDKIDVFLDTDDRNAFIRVEDYGMGIPAQEIERVFERFYRVDKARSRETGGTGLGLSIAKNIIKLHKGEIKIKSEEDKGTVVKLIIPK
ncbi:HAMP domain-containing histidine kinase [Neobacillus pocheonensis]|uniref:histidine kinase n=1 Tax=Neobacillus pocheonensis TaxID=363869 RepID=A0ABT0W9D6_9BACI|nr:HAMP domain-containing histidine kinase [Neobacillus pocheonensis]